MRYVSVWAVAVFLTGCPTRARDHGDGGGGGSGGDTGQPSIAIVAPATMTFANGDVAIEVRVSGGTATKVALLRNDMAWQELSGPPFQFAWDTRPAADGDYILTASATVGGKPVSSDPVTVTVDHTPPQITDVTPARGSASGDLAAPIKVTFSEPVLASTVKDSSVALTVGSAAVPSTVSLAADGKSLTVTITDPKSLALPADFVATVATTITDRAGNALAPLDPAWTWTVPLWIKLPPLATVLPPRLAVDASGRTVLAYATLDNIGGDDVQQLHVARFESGAWNTALGAPSMAKGTANYGYSVALDSNANPTVAWSENTVEVDVRVASWTGSAWNTTYPPLSAIHDVGADATLPSVRVDSNDHPVVAWREQTGSFPTYDIYAARWDGAAWIRLNGMGYMGGAGFSRPLDGPQLVLDAQGNPLFGWVESGVGTGVSFWTGTDWVRSQAQLGGSTPYPALDTTGTPWMTVKSTDLHVVKWDKTMLNWPEATAALTTSASWGGPRIALAPNGSPVVAWLDTTGPIRIGVARWTGTAWDTKFGLFNAGQSPATDIPPELVVDARGKIWVAWKEGTAAQVWSANY